MAIITNLKSKGNVLSAQTFSVRGVELQIGGQYATTGKTGQVLAYNDTLKAMELISVTAISGVTTIGAPQTGNYTDDGLLPLTNDTKIGHAIDMINEVLKSLSPKTAQSVTSISTPSITGLSNVRTAFGVDRNDYSTEGYITGTSINRNDNTAKIVKAGTPFTMTFKVNGGVPAGEGVGTYPAEAFLDINVGELVAYVNGVEKAKLNLATVTTATTATTINEVEFTLTAVGHVLLDGKPMPTAPYRTATIAFKKPHLVDTTTGFRKGYNTVKVVRELSGKDISSTDGTFLLVDSTDASAKTISNDSMSTPVVAGLTHLSGIKYNTSISANHTADVTNMYNVVYHPSGAISEQKSGFTSTSISVSGSTLGTAQTGGALPLLGSTSNAKTQSVNVYSTLARTTTTYPDEVLRYGITAKHPLSSDVATTPKSATGFLLYTDSSSATSLVEDFKRETFRLQNAFYTGETPTTIASKAWDSTKSVFTGDAEHINGLAIWKNKLVHPKSILTGATAAYGNLNNEDFTTMTADGTYFRKFQLTSLGDKTSFTLNFAGVGQFMTNVYSNVDASGVLPKEVDQAVTGQNVAISVLIIKGDTSGEYMGKKYGYFNPLAKASVQSNFGVSDAATINNNGTANNLNIQVASTMKVNSNDTIIVRVKASKDWTGSITSMSIAG
jgi:hypothetical protein